jgi:hypothetical protein
MKRSVAALALLTSLSACVATGRLPEPAATAPALDPLAFFAGATRGEGRLQIATRRPRTVQVAGMGRIGPDGVLQLDQSVSLAGKPPVQRQWQLSRNGQGGIAGSLTDASGPVTGAMEKGRLRLRFAMKGGFRAEQILALQADGRTLKNVMIVRKFGLPVARLDETITKVGE